MSAALDAAKLDEWEADGQAHGPLGHCRLTLPHADFNALIAAARRGMTTPDNPEAIRREVEGQIEAWLRRDDLPGFTSFSALADAIARGEHRTTQTVGHIDNAETALRRAGHSRLKYDKATRTIVNEATGKSALAAQDDRDRIRAEVIEDCIRVANEYGAHRHVIDALAARSQPAEAKGAEKI